jgi:hypothetical protein
MSHHSAKKTVGAAIIFLILAVFFSESVCAFNIEKIGDKGLFPHPGGDRHNSYAWCMGILPHSDGDYLYVGSNRDVAYLVTAGLFRTIKNTTDYTTVKGYVETLYGGDIIGYPTQAEVDLRPRIFRLKLNSAGASWELIYTAPIAQGIVPLELGYRGMQVFTDSVGETALYVVSDAGATKVSRVLKISADSDPQNVIVQEVFRVQGTASLRPIAVHGGKLYIGANNDIYEASNPESMSDWTKIAADSDFGGLVASGKKAMLWQFASFNDYLYVTLAEDVDPVQQPQTADNGGAWLFKGQFDAGLAQWVWTPIVADQSLFPAAPYPKGMGNRFNSTFSLASFKDNLYVGTLMTFPSLIGTGNVQLVLQNRIPPQIYRVSKTDVCAMVIGDTVGPTRSSVFPSRIGNYGAGFFVPNIFQTLSFDETIRNANFSLNQYLWWMAEYNGKLYASTFDLRVFLKYLTRTNLEVLGVLVPGDNAAWQTVQTMLSALDLYNDNPPGCDIYYTSDGVNWSPLTRDGFGDPFNYGARVLLPPGLADQPFYVGMANPFYGAQVYTVRDTGSGQGSPDGGGGGCFIATAAFGSALDPHVGILRDFRDRFLMVNAPGRSFVRFYYSQSPAAASFLERHEGLKAMVRLGLTPVIGICYLFLNGFGAMVIIGFALLPMAVLLICLGRRRRQKGSVECC